MDQAALCTLHPAFHLPRDSFSLLMGGPLGSALPSAIAISKKRFGFVEMGPGPGSGLGGCEGLEDRASKGRVGALCLPVPEGFLSIWVKVVHLQGCQ